MREYACPDVAISTVARCGMWLCEGNAVLTHTTCPQRRRSHLHTRTHARTRTHTRTYTHMYTPAPRQQRPAASAAAACDALQKVLYYCLTTSSSCAHLYPCLPTASTQVPPASLPQALEPPHLYYSAHLYDCLSCPYKCSSSLFTTSSSTSSISRLCLAPVVSFIYFVQNTQVLTQKKKSAWLQWNATRW